MSNQAINRVSGHAVVGLSLFAMLCCVEHLRQGRAEAHRSAHASGTPD